MALRNLLKPQRLLLFRELQRGSSRFVTSSSSSGGGSLRRFLKWGVAGGTLLGVGYSAYTHYAINANKQASLIPVDDEPTVLNSLPEYVAITRRVVGTLNDDLGLVLFQYQTCPFCCKVRAFLDSNGFSYDIVEVDAVLRQSIKWSKYKKVPIVLVKTKHGYRQLNDSTVIISVLSSYLISKFQDVGEIIKYYPSISYNDDDGKPKHEILNKYFLMHQQSVSDEMHEKLSEERRWRKWSDDVLVHVLSPNVYRTLDEAHQAFDWFANTGEWRQIFPAWEVNLMINVGAFVMWLIGKKLKKKHQLKDDVRQSLYDECNKWTRTLKAKGTTFMGGSKPDLSDLAVYGVLSSIEGCEAFQDALHNTKINRWYTDMKQYIRQNQTLSQTT